MSLVFQVRAETFPIRGTFTISRGSKTVAEVVVVELERDGFIGRGESVPYKRYGESVEGVIDEISQLLKSAGDELTTATLSSQIKPGAARNAIDCALWDLAAKSANRPVWQLLALPEPHDLVTAFTLSLDEPSAMAMAAQQSARPLLKLKLGGGEIDIERVQAVRRAAPQSRLIVDANEAWTPEQLEHMLAAMAEAQVELIEQPLPAGQDEALRHVRHLVKICADESCHDRASLPDLVGKYDFINIKLDKTGGLTEALLMAQAAKSLGLELMVGCMVGTSLAMAPAMLVGQQARVIDLDGPLLLAQDRTPAIAFNGSTMSWPTPALWG